jgi:hypothetical protein
MARRRKKQRPQITLPGGEQVAQRTIARKPSEDAQKTALDARCHHFGILPTKDARQALSAPHNGAAIGMVMNRTMTDLREVAALWAVWQAWCSVERTYRTRILGNTGSPKGASIASLPDKLETDQRHTVDTRTSEERDKDATTAYMRWRGYIGQLYSAEQSLLHRAEREDGPPLWAERAPTIAGIATLAALKRLAKIAGA